MKSFALAALASQILPVFGFEIKVGASGGNATSGHQYGFLHEGNLNAARQWFKPVTYKDWRYKQ
jgi:hypothetical protein